MSTKWIDAETPPAEDENVLLHFDHGGPCCFAIGYYGGDGRWFEIKGYKCDETDAEPSHWTELPPIPE